MDYLRGSTSHPPSGKGSQHRSSNYSDTNTYVYESPDKAKAFDDAFDDGSDDATVLPPLERVPYLSAAVPPHKTITKKTRWVRVDHCCVRVAAQAISC